MPMVNDTLGRVPMIVVGTAPWAAPWLTEQNLAFSLAARHRTLYVEPPQIVPRRRGEDGRPRLRYERLGGRDIVIFRPIVLPLRSRAVSAKASAPMYRAQLRTLVRRLGLEGAIVLAGDARPGIVGAADECLSSYIVKDWIYEDPQLLGRSAADLVAERDAMCAAVDIVLAISPSLQRSLAEAGIASQVLRHGFHQDLAAEYDGVPPAEYAELAGPKIVFAGRIDDRLDISKLRAVARHFSSGSVVLIGPISPRMDGDALTALRQESNVHLLGVRPRRELPPYLTHAECLLIPYRDSVWAHHGSPLKLWDYLYAGPPIVGSGYTALADYPSFVRFANDDREFVASVESAVRHDDGRQARRAFALANTWEERSLELEEIFAVLERSSDGRRRA